MHYTEIWDSDKRLISWPIIQEVDEIEVVAAMRSSLTGYDAPPLLALEEAFGVYCHVRHCLGFNGGTASIHAALAACGVGPGDEVIVPAISFSGTFHPILALGAIPVFVDIDPITFNIDPDKIYDAVTNRTKAIIPVHLHGLMADMSVMLEMRESMGLYIIEDACQAHGAGWNACMAGTVGDFGCFSLNHTKSLPAGEGGLLITNNTKLNDRANQFRIFGESLPRDIDRQLGRTYMSTTTGLNYLMPAMTAALARSQLDHLPDYNERALMNATLLNRLLKGSDLVTPPSSPNGYLHVYHKYRLMLSPDVNRDMFLDNIRNKGVPAGLWQVAPLPLYPIFLGQHKAEQFPNAVNALNQSIIVGTEKYPLCAQDTDTVIDWANIIKEELLTVWKC